MAERIAFNLLVNGVTSFLAGLLMVFFTLKLLRAPSTRERLYLLCLPFVKIVWDLARGIPRHSYLYAGLDPLSLPPKSSELEISAGFDYGPLFRIVFNVQDAARRRYTISGADYLNEWLLHHGSPRLPWCLLMGLAAVSLSLLLRRLILAYRFGLARRRDRRLAEPLPAPRLGWRRIDLYLSPGFHGTPFTGGLLRPYICFPRDAHERMTEPERRAVIEHELAHVAHFDVALSLAVECLGDIFWFVPGYRLLGRRISRLRELEADRSAVARGAAPEHLARALLELADSVAPAAPFVYSALVKERSLLSIRVNALMAEPEPGRGVSWIRLAGLLFATASVLLCSIGGNHDLLAIPPWLEKILRAWGWL